MPDGFDGSVQDRSRRGRTVGIVILAVVGGFGLLLGVAATVDSGLGGTFVVAGLVAVILGLGAVVIGRRWWALIGSRKVGAGFLVGGLAMVIGGGLALPRTETSQPVETVPHPASSAAASSSAPTTSESAEPVWTADDVNALIANAKPATALAALGVLSIREALSATGYDQVQFGPLWADANTNGCDTRNDILARDLTNQQVQTDCVVLAGQLLDPYTATRVSYTRNPTTNGTVDVDAVVTLANAWVTGAQGWDAAARQTFANDPFNLLAVGVQTGSLEHRGDAAGWVPSNVAFRCEYLARQIAVRTKYRLWVTDRERAATAGILTTCPTQGLPSDTAAMTAAADKQAADAIAAKETADKQAADAAAAAAAKAAVEQAAAASASAAAQAVADQQAADAAAAATKAVSTPAPPVVAPEQPAPSAYYANCTDARAAGVTPILRGEPGYSSKLDRDGDGVACE
jgi:hypothetical protein